jgi:beta-lactamase regulating signal transducer with metallopeptidase domain
MTLAFFPRLLCLALACFSLVHVITTLLVAACTPLAIRKAPALTTRKAANLFLTLRLLPSALALFAAVGLCAPGYLWFEPERFDEPVGLACILLALFGAAICALSIARAARASIKTWLFARHSRRSGEQIILAAQYPPALVIDSAEPLLALTGVVHPQVVISRNLASALSPEELNAVLRHECAHRDSGDNFKRLCMFLSPWSMPMLAGAAKLERSWISFAEFEADRQAVAGDGRRSLALASALVRVARAGNLRTAIPVSISFLADASDLSARVDRLLTLSPASPSSRPVSWRAAGYALMLTTCIAVLLFRPDTLRLVQSLLERLVR